MPEKLINCLIVDDEPLARRIIRQYIEQVPYLNFSGECGNAIAAFGELQQKAIDLIFLDIRMPQLNGTDFLKALKNPPQVIFTTAYSEYALDGFELDAIDFLMKPIPFERFLKAVGKISPTGFRSSPELGAASAIRNDGFVYFRSERKMVKVMLDEILYIESMKDYVKIYTSSGMLITKQSISSVEAMLSEKQFIRTHRSFIASVTHIKSYTAESLEINKAEIPIGKLYRNEVMKKLGESNFQ